MTFMNQYEEHLASQPDNSRWDGFDRGTLWTDKDEYGSTVIGRMTNKLGQRVVITEEYARGDLFYDVTVSGVRVYFGEDRLEALDIARSWMGYQN